MSETDMEKWLRRSAHWDDDYKKYVHSIVTKCQCSEASHPQGHPKVSRGQLVTPIAYGEVLCVDTIYLKGCLFLRAIDRYRKFGVFMMLKSRSASEIEKELADMLDEFRRQAHRRSQFKRLTCDREFVRASSLLDWIKRHGVDTRAVAIEGHSQNGAIEAENRVLRMFFDRIVAANAVVDEIAVIVRAAVKAKNACVGNKHASATEIWTRTIPQFSQEMLTGGSHTIAIPSDIETAFEARKARSSFARLMRERGQDPKPIREGDYVRFYRDR
jgi:hypothetical protein